MSPICISRRKRSIDNLKIAMFRHQSAGETTCQEERPIHGITRYLQEHLAEEVSLGVLAEEFHLNPQYISQLFKSEIGVNFLTYFTNIRMEQAKKLLLTTSLPIAEISEQSGPTTGCSPRYSKSQRASHPPSTAGIFWNRTDKNSAIHKAGATQEFCGPERISA